MSADKDRAVRRVKQKRAKDMKRAARKAKSVPVDCLPPGAASSPDAA